MDKYSEFLRIAKHLNSELDIIPVLYGSLGLSRIIQKDLNSKDIDILVPQRYITKDWDKLINTLAIIGYQLFSEEEHEFIYLDTKIGIAFEEDLYPFAKIKHEDLKIMSDYDARFKILDINQYKKIYETSKNDSYRSDKNNKKDFEKIKLIDNIINNNNFYSE